MLFIPITSNRGLCGGFNANIFKKIKELSQTKFQNMDVEVFCIGKKASDAAGRAKYNIINLDENIIDDCKPDIVKKHCNFVKEKFLMGEWHSVYIVYNKFKNAATQIVTDEKFLPIDVNLENEKKSLQDYIFEPDKKEIINALLPKKLEIQFFKSILDSIASEHGARMTAMHKATDNAEELRQDLTLTYNRQRQAAITNEILEIVAGAEALRGS